MKRRELVYGDKVMRAMLQGICQHRAKVERLSIILDKEKTLLEARESQVISILDTVPGKFVRLGKFYARIKSVGRRCVAWKQVVIDLKGEEYAEEILEDTPKTFHTHLEIELNQEQKLGG